MLKSLYKILPTKIEEDEDTSSRILNLYICFTIVACSMLMIFDWMYPIGDNTPFIYIVAINIFLFWALKYTGARTIIGNLYISVWAIILVNLSFETGALYSMDALSMSLIPLTGFALINYKSGFGWLIFYLAFLYYLWAIMDTPTVDEFYRAQTLLFDKSYYLVGGLIFAFFTFCMFFISFSQNQRLLSQLKTNQVALKSHVDQLDKQSILLNQAQEDLKRSNMELEEFAYATSHDLKQPLRTVNSFANLLQSTLNKQDILDTETSQMLQFIMAGSTKMNTLITDLLAFAKLKKEVDITFTKVDLDNLLQSVLFDLKESMDTSGAVVRLARLPELQVIPVKMNQLFQNLISNAIKFRKKDTVLNIQISAKEKVKHWEFIVKDNGIGIQKEHQEKIFAPFKKLHNSAEYEGTGIGLATCMHIVKLHKGRIWVTSNFGEGTIFHFTIAKNLMNTQKAARTTELETIR